MREGLIPRAATRAVDAVQFAGCRVVDNGEKIAADPVAGGFHQAQRGIGGDCRIDRAAAVLEHIERDLRRQRMRGRRHAVLRDHRAARPVGADRTAAAADLFLDRGPLGGVLRSGRDGGEGKGCNARQ